MSDQPQNPLWATAAAFMAGLAARDLLARPQTQAEVRRALRRVNPRTQDIVEKWMARGLEVMVQEGEKTLKVWVRDAAGRVRDVTVKARPPVVDLDEDT